MKVLHVIPSISPLRGGPSKAVIDMVRALNDIGVSAEIATTNDNGPEKLEVELEALTSHQGVPVIFFDRFSPPQNAVREFAYSGGFRRWLKQHIDDYDLLHIHAIFSFASSYAMALARRRNIPYVLRPIGQLEPWALRQSRLRKHLFLQLFENSNLLGAAAIQFTAESEQTKTMQALSELQGVHSEIIPLGIELPQKVPNARQQIIRDYQLEGEKKIILFLSRLHVKKGLELLLESLSRISQENWQLLIAGTGEPAYVRALETKVAQLGLTSRCRFIGFVDGTPKQLLLQGADLYTLTSYAENFGIAVLEALAAGTPALVSRDVALSKLIESQRLGYVCDTNVRSVSQQLTIALGGESDIGKEAAEYVAKTFDWGQIAARLSALYQQINASKD